MFNDGCTKDAALGVMSGCPDRKVACWRSPRLVREAAAWGVGYTAVDAWERGHSWVDNPGTGILGHFCIGCSLVAVNTCKHMGLRGQGVQLTACLHCSLYKQDLVL